MTDYHRLLADLPTPDHEAATSVRARADDILRPPGALARLDDIAVWLAGWQRTAEPDVVRPAGLIFAADHGVAAAGVTAYPSEVTAAMVAAFEQGKATISAMAEVAGASLRVIDVGVGRPTANLVEAPAMDRARFAQAFDAGRAAVAESDADLLVLGEMGIGNTTPAAAIAAKLLGGEAGAWVGRGTGIDDAGLERKRSAVAAAVQRIDAVTDPFEVLRHVGGAELVAIAGAALEARRRSIPVLLDGFIVTAAVLPLFAANPTALSHCQAAHRSAEPGHGRLLEHVGLAPLLTLDLRLGEGSGAMAAVPLVKMAARAVTRVATFTEWFA